MEIQDEEIKLQFLVSGSYDALPSAYLKLRSYLNIYSSTLANIHSLKLPKAFTKNNLICKQCFLPWSHESCSIKLVPNKKQSKISSKSKANLEELTKTHLVLKCNVCTSRSHFYFPKRLKTKNAIFKQEEVRVEKKKKKKKDKTCGLRNAWNANSKKHDSEKASTKNSSISKLKIFAVPTANVNKKEQQSQLQVKNSTSMSQPSTGKIKPIPSNKNTMWKNNPGKLKNKSLKKKNQNLQKLQKLQTLIQKQKEPVKKTLKDFLTLI